MWVYHVISRISNPQFLQSVEEKGTFMKQQIQSRLQPFFESGLIKELRGSGLLLGLKINQDPKPIVSAALDQGLLLAAAGENTIRLIPPLIITKTEIDQGLNILTKVLSEFSQSR